MILAAMVVVLGAIGTYLLLPHQHGRGGPRALHGAGAVAAGLGLLGFMMFWSPPGPFLATVFFYVFGLSSIVGGLADRHEPRTRCTVRSGSRRSCYRPRDSSCWPDAPFLAAGTIIVYAGAIIVTFLFVIMLAQMEGKADYDRAARSPAWATLTCFLILWCLIVSVATIRTGPPVPLEHSRAAGTREEPRARLNLVAYESSNDSRHHHGRRGSVARHVLISEPPSPDGDAPPARRTVRSRPGSSSRTSPAWARRSTPITWSPSSIAGALLFVALIGAVAITTPERPIRPGTDPAQVAATGVRPALREWNELRHDFSRSVHPRYPARLPAGRRRAVRAGHARVPQPAEPDRDVPLGRDDAPGDGADAGRLRSISRQLDRTGLHDRDPDGRGVRGVDRAGLDPDPVQPAVVARRDALAGHPRARRAGDADDRRGRGGRADRGDAGPRDVPASDPRRESSRTIPCSPGSSVRS